MTSINPPLTRSYQDYIKDDSDGITAHINRKGMQIYKSFLSKNKGVMGVHRITGISRPALTTLRDKGHISPDKWEELYGFMVPSKQEQAA